MILYIKHIDIEGPGTLGTFLLSKGFENKTVALNQGDVFPESLSDIEAVISLGGPMNVYEEQNYSFLIKENEFIQKVLTRKIPFLGICLGSQLLAKACGGKVQKSPRAEIGFYSVKLTDKGKDDPLFWGMEDSFEVFQWHEDMFCLPPQASLLASSEYCPFQAFTLWPNAYALQFHIEIIDKSIESWASDYWPQDDCSFEKKKIQMLLDYKEKKEKFQNTALQIYNNFLKVIKRV